MAEFGAHLTTVVAGPRPSVFDVVAQETLMSTLKPALSHAFKVLAEYDPLHFQWLFRLSDEIYSLLDLTLQNYFLRTYSGSFAENFYGLKRVYHGVHTKLPTQAVRKSLVLLVLVPYIKLKMNKLFERLRLERADGLYSSQCVTDRLRNLFTAVYPVFHLLWDSSLFVYLFLYTFNKAQHHSPFIHLSGTTLSMLTEQDLLNQDVLHKSVDLSLFSVKERIQYLVRRCFSYTLSSISVGLSVSVFFLQFLEWWYNSEHTQVSPTDLPIPNPPKQLDSDINSEPANVCLVCHRVRTNDTALSVSGYVFCYPCIYNYVKSNKRCPVTGYPCETQHLIKLYLDST